MKQSNFKVHGYFAVSVFSGYEIEISNDGGAARVRYSFYNSRTGKTENSPRPRFQEIKFNNAGTPFVKFHGRRLMLDNFLRTL